MNLKLGPDEELRSYHVSVLFTSVPMDKALEVIKDRLLKDQDLERRTPLSPDDIIDLLGFCLNCTYFLFQGELKSIGYFLSSDLNGLTFIVKNNNGST